MQTHQDNLDLKDIVIKRMISIRNEIENPQFKQTIEKQELEKINREFDFLYGVLEKTRDETDTLFFVETKKEIESLLAQYLSDFKLQYESAKLTYKEVHKGVNYDNLRRLTKHQSFTDGYNQKLIHNLLNDIHCQYEKHLRQITVSLDVNENIETRISKFLNIY